MTQLGLANHELAAKVGTSRQTIYKLRNGITRMLPDWAKRIAPFLGVPWQELVDGTPLPLDREKAELLAAFDAMDREQRQALLTMAKGVVRRDPTPEVAPTPPAKQPAVGRAVSVAQARTGQRKIPDRV
jgi:transcriptional regulator with XRE-family HTH domain